MRQHENVRHKPIVFASLTCYDLQQVREGKAIFWRKLWISNNGNILISCNLFRMQYFRKIYWNTWSIYIFGTLINDALQDAMGECEELFNLDMMIYVFKQIASIYKHMVEWGLYFKSVHTEELFVINAVFFLDLSWGKLVNSCKKLTMK